MAEKVYTQQEFANLAGISTATVVKMLNEGSLKREISGRIPSSELYKIYTNYIRKYANKGTLIICIGDTTNTVDKIKTEFENYSSSFNKNGSKAVCIDSINSLIDNMLTNFDGASADIKQLQRQFNYNKKVIDSFISRYNTVVMNKLIKLLSDPDCYNLMKLPFEVLWKLFLCGELKDTLTTEQQAILDSCKTQIKSKQGKLNERFNAIMTDLFLTNPETGEFLFRRSDITTGFMTKTGDEYKDYFYDKKGNIDPVKLCGSLHIAHQLDNRDTGSRFKSNIDKYISSGYYLVYNIGALEGLEKFKDYNDVDLVEKLSKDPSNLLVRNQEDELAKLISSNLFTKILINCKEADMQEVLTKKINTALELVKSNNLAIVENIKQEEE